MVQFVPARLFASSASQPLKRKFCQYVELTGQERTFSNDNLIVTKTNLTGHITYANKTFCDIAGVTEKEALGAPHSIIRHPDMPRCVFKLLWDTLADRREIFAYVVNMASNGDHYWVFAHVTPTLNEQGEIIGYHSNRRVPDGRCVAEISGLYKMLGEIEQANPDRDRGMNAALDKMLSILKDKGVSYDEFIFML